MDTAVRSAHMQVPSSPSARAVTVIRLGPSGPERRQDAVSAEEPLEIRLQGSSYLVTMRTPGADPELAAGLLLSERVIQRREDLARIRHCEDTSDAGNVLDVTLTGTAAERAEGVLAARRLVTATSACG